MTTSFEHISKPLGRVIEQAAMAYAERAEQELKMFHAKQPPPTTCNSTKISKKHTGQIT